MKAAGTGNYLVKDTKINKFSYVIFKSFHFVLFRSRCFSEHFAFGGCSVHVSHPYKTAVHVQN